MKSRCSVHRAGLDGKWFDGGRFSFDLFQVLYLL
jgi:hypothetical protein